jgi:hypothetical protein
MSNNPIRIIGTEGIEDFPITPSILSFPLFENNDMIHQSGTITIEQFKDADIRVKLKDKDKELEIGLEPMGNGKKFIDPRGELSFQSTFHFSENGIPNVLGLNFRKDFISLHLNLRLEAEYLSFIDVGFAKYPIISPKKVRVYRINQNILPIDALKEDILKIVDKREKDKTREEIINRAALKLIEDNQISPQYFEERRKVVEKSEDFQKKIKKYDEIKNSGKFAELIKSLTESQADDDDH